jgi:cyclopropane fatty-acyl-phospholipid synthase-like methyltransferase
MATNTTETIDLESKNKHMKYHYQDIIQTPAKFDVLCSQGKLEHRGNVVYNAYLTEGSPKSTLPSKKTLLPNARERQR